MLVADPAVAIPALHPQGLVGHLPRSMQHYPPSNAPVDVGVALELCSDRLSTFAACPAEFEDARGPDPPAPPPEAARPLVEALTHQQHL